MGLLRVERLGIGHGGWPGAWARAREELGGVVGVDRALDLRVDFAGRDGDVGFAEVGEREQERPEAIVVEICVERVDSRARFGPQL